MIKKIIFVVIGVFFTINVALAANEWTAWSTIKQIGMAADGNAYMQLNTASVNPSFCQFGAASQGLVGGAGGFREMYALLLSAQASNSEVILLIDGSTCANKRGRILQIFSR